MNLSPAEQLVLAYAVNRNVIAEVSKKIAALTDWQRPDKGVSLDNIRTDYLEDGDQWRGWMHAIDHVMGIRDEDDESITDLQLELAILLDTKAALRIEAGTIKRRITTLGRNIARANDRITARQADIKRAGTSIPV